MTDLINAFARETDETLQFMRFAMDHASTAIYWVGRDARIHYVNYQACKRLGYTEDELMQLSIPDLDPLFSIAHWNEHWESLRQKKTLTFETQHKSKNGDNFPVEVIANYVKFGAFEYNVAYAQDITERKAAEAALEISKQQFDRLAANIPVGVFILHTSPTDQYSLKYISPRFCELYGIAAEELYRDPSCRMRSIHPDDLDEFVRRNQDALQSHSPFLWEGRILISGKIGWLRIQSKPEAQPDGSCIWDGIVTDITEQIQAQETIRSLAFIDTLTNLPNRRMLDDRLSQALALSKRTERYGAIMFIDLDNFKPLNDRYGHNAGDLLLIAAAQRLRHCMREIDTVARFGGDEFVVILCELDKGRSEAVFHATTAAEKIQTALCAPYELALPASIPGCAITHHCSASIGVTIFINHEAGTEELLKRADQAMYKAKDAGRNSICFYDEDVR